MISIWSRFPKFCLLNQHEIFAMTLLFDNLLHCPYNLSNTVTSLLFILTLISTMMDESRAYYWFTFECIFFSTLLLLLVSNKILCI